MSKIFSKFRNKKIALKEDIQDATDDPDVKGILMHIDSPGGEASGLFDLSDALYQARDAKPLWAVAGDAAYSAAYGIASAAEKIFITRTGGVGSVGVICVHVDVSKANEKEGLNYTIFRGGKYKAETNPYEELTDHAHKNLQAEVERLYQLFAGTIARNRSMTVSEVLKMEAQCYHGENGVKAGLADAVGTLEEAHAQMVAHITSNEDRKKQHAPPPLRNRVESYSQLPPELSQFASDPSVQRLYEDNCGLVDPASIKENEDGFTSDEMIIIEEGWSINDRYYDKNIIDQIAAVIPRLRKITPSSEINPSNTPPRPEAG